MSVLVVFEVGASIRFISYIVSLRQVPPGCLVVDVEMLQLF